MFNFNFLSNTIFGSKASNDALGLVPNQYCHLLYKIFSTPFCIWCERPPIQSRKIRKNIWVFVILVIRFASLNAHRAENSEVLCYLYGFFFHPLYLCI